VARPCRDASTYAANIRVHSSGSSTFVPLIPLDASEEAAREAEEEDEVEASAAGTSTTE